jgi:hypothetical protein
VEGCHFEVLSSIGLRAELELNCIALARVHEIKRRFSSRDEYTLDRLQSHIYMYIMLYQAAVLENPLSHQFHENCI